MLKFDDLYEEIETAELAVKEILKDMKEDDTVGTGTVSMLGLLVKLSTLNLKLLHNIRANQSKAMVAQGVKKIDPKKTYESEKR